MEIRQIRCFAAVADTGSFTRAAERCFISQPALSESIRKLEDELGVKLFERGKARARLTWEGERLLARARVILHEVNAAAAETRRDTRVRRLKLGLLNTLPVFAIAQITGGFAGRNRLDLELLTAGANELQRWLLAGRLSAAVTIEPSDTATGLDHHVLFRDCQTLAVFENHPLSRRAPLNVNDVDGEPLIVRTHCEHLEHARRLLEKFHSRPRVVNRTASDMTALELVAAGIGHCLMPNSFSHPGVRMLPVRGVKLTREIAIVWRKDADATLSRLVQAFQDCNWRIPL